MTDLDDLVRQASQIGPAQLDSRICEGLMLAYYDVVFRLAQAFLGDPCEADDAAQETFIQAALHIHQYEAGTNLKSWLAKIAFNICRGKYRRQKMLQRLEQVLKLVTFQMNMSTPSVEDSCIQSEQRRTILRAVGTLDEKHRLPVLLHYMQGFSVPEIAHLLDENEGTIYSRLHYANGKLRSRLDGQIDFGPEKKVGLK